MTLDHFRSWLPGCPVRQAGGDSHPMFWVPDPLTGRYCASVSFWDDGRVDLTLRDPSQTVTYSCLIRSEARFALVAALANVSGLGLDVRSAFASALAEIPHCYAWPSPPASRP